MGAGHGGTLIYYDDGTDDYWLNPIPGWSDLVLFTPPYTPAKLTQLDFYIWASSTGSYKAIVFDGAGNQIYLSDFQNVATGTDGWVTIDLSAESIPITGDFYAGLEFQESGTLRMGCDNSPPVTDRNYIYIPSNPIPYQIQPWLSSNFMIRETIEPTVIEVNVDVKPGSELNPLAIQMNGFISVAVLGAEDFNVNQIDPATVNLEGVAPIRWYIEDLDIADGFNDLVIKFDAQEIIAALGAVDDGDIVELTLYGNLKAEFGGDAISGKDVVLIISK